MRDSIKRFEVEITAFESIMEDSQIQKAVLAAAKKEENLGGYTDEAQIDELIRTQQAQIDYYKEQVRTKQKEITEYNGLINLQEMQEHQANK